MEIWGDEWWRIDLIDYSVLVVPGRLFRYRDTLSHSSQIPEVTLCRLMEEGAKRRASAEMNQF